MSTHPSGSPLCAVCNHTKLMHLDDGTPCSVQRCNCKKFVAK